MGGNERTTMAQPCKNSTDAPHTKEVRSFRLREDKDAQEAAPGARRKHRIQHDDPSRYESVECTRSARHLGLKIESVGWLRLIMGTSCCSNIHFMPS